MKRAVSVYEKTNPAALYDCLHSGRRKLVVPYYISDEAYANWWGSVSYRGKSFEKEDVEIYTENGERVRSKSEKILADMLERYGVPYKYECPYEYSGERIIYPDFTVLNKRTRISYFWEHFGMMDDPKYMKNAVFKLEEYQRHGIYPGKQLICTFETKNRPFNVTAAKSLIHEYLI